MSARARRVLAGLLSAALGVGLVAAVAPAPASAASLPPRPIVTGWMPYWTNSASLASVVNNADLFKDVSPFWFSTRGNAPSIYVASQAGGIATSTVVATLHSKGIKVLPTVTDGSGRLDMSAQLSTSTGRSRMVGVLTNLVVANKFDGIDLDWEGFAFSDGQSSWSTTRPRWVAFVTSLAAALHARGKMLAVTAPAGLGTSSDSTGYWVYAWGEIGPYVDRLRIMAYDYSVSNAGPIAPMTWIDRVVAKAVTQVPSRKIQIGIASYGRDWKTGQSGMCPNVAPSSSTSASFFSKMTWAMNRHEFSARQASTYVKNLFVDAAATIPGIRRVQAPVSTYDTTAQERTFGYAVAFDGTFQASTLSVATAAGILGQTSVIVTSTDGVSVGDRIAGSGVAAGATVTGVGANVLTLSAAHVGNVSGALTATHVATSPATGAAASTSISLPGTVAVVTGATVTGTGIAAGTTVTAVAPDPTPGLATIVTLSKPTTGAVSGTATFTSTLSVGTTASVPGSTTVRVVDGSAVKAQAAVTGSGIAAGTVTSADGTPHVLTLSKPTTGVVSGSLSAKPAAVPASCTISRTGWYADAQSAVAGARLVGKYLLAGIAEWTIGGEDTAQWAPIRSYATSIAQLPTAVSLTAPRSQYIGRTAVLRAYATSNGAAFAGAQVWFQWRKAGTTTWVRKGIATTGADGRVAWTTPAASSSGQWRAYVPDTWYRLASAVIAPTTTAVKTPTAIALSATSRVSLGSAAVATARATSLGKPLVGIRVNFYWRPATSTTWALVGGATTDATGVAKRAYKPSRSGYWRAVTAATWARAGYTTTTTVATALVPVVSLSATSVSTRVGAAASVRAATKPAGAGQVVLVQRKTSTGWANVATLSTDKYGRVTFTIPTARRGTSTYRFFVRPTAIHAAAVSKNVVVSVA